MTHNLAQLVKVAAGVSTLFSPESTYAMPPAQGGEGGGVFSLQWGTRGQAGKGKGEGQVNNY